MTRSLIHKLICICIAGIMFLSSCPVMAEPISDKDAAVYIPGGAKGGLRAYRQSGSEPVTQKIQGKDAYVFEAKGSDVQKTLYFSLTDSNLRQKINEGYGVAITVEYLDSDNGCLALMYDPVFDEIDDTYYDWKYKPNGTLTEGFLNATTVPGKFAGFIEMENTNLWTKETFYVRDPRFLRRLPNDSDFYLTVQNIYSGNSTTDVAISSVTLTLMDTKSVARIYSTSGNIGNIFFSDSPVKFDTQIISTTKSDFNGEAVFTVINNYDALEMYDRPVRPLKTERDGTLDKKYLLEQKRENITLKAGETLTKTVEFDISQFGCMTYRVELIDESNNVYTVYDQCITRVARKSDDELLDSLGIAMHYFVGDACESEQYARTGFEMLARAGIKWIRGDVHWQATEPVRYDYKLTKAQENFLRINVDEYNGDYKMYPIINGQNDLIGYKYEDFENSYEAKLAFAQNTEAVVSLMKPYGVDTYEIINEPNLGGLTPQVYKDLLEITWKEVKAKHPDVLIAGPATAEVPVLDKNDYIPNFFEAGGLDYVDIVAVHPYNWRYAPEFGGHDTTLSRLDELCQEYGKSDVEVWATERGFPTAIKNNTSIALPGDDTGLFGQAAWLVRDCIIRKGDGLLDKTFIYTLFDGPDRSETENRFGMVRGYTSAYEPFVAKLSFPAVSNMSVMLNGAEFTECKQMADKAVNAYEFKKNDGSDLVALWTTNKKDPVSISLGAREITVSDMYGNKHQRFSESGIYDFVLDEGVTYVMGNFSDFELQEAKLSYDALTYTAVPGEEYDFKITNNTGLPLTIKCIPGAGVEVVKEAAFNGNAAQGSFVLSDSEKSELLLEFYNGDQLYSNASYRITPTNVVDFELESCEPYNENTLNRWAMTILVKNNRAEKPVSGYIKLESPASVVGKLSPIRVESIPAGKQRRIKFYLPEMNKKYKESLSGMFTMDDGTKQYLSLGVDFTIAKYASSSPKLDGIIEDGEWTTGAWLYMDLRKQVRENDGWKGTDDISARANIMWDTDYFYLATVVTDDIFGATSNEPMSAWMNDGLQIGVKCDMQTNMSAYNEMSISNMSGEPVIYRNKAEGVASTGLVKNFQGTIRRDEESKTTTYEFAIPWEELITDDFVIEPDISIAFSMMVNENDGTGRKGWIELTPGIGYEKDPRLFTNIRLIR